MRMPLAPLRPPLSPRRFAARHWQRAGEPIAGKRILLTGASSGIGRSAAIQLARLGAEMVIVARREGELAALQDEILSFGGAVTYRACDLSQADQVDDLLAWIADTGGIDVLINNAARSIRRPLIESFDRFHDFERTMALNYFGPVRLTMGVLPAMVARGDGHVINVGTWSVPIDTAPKMTAYHSSKAAFAAFSRCANAELSGRGVQVTTVQFPLVHTPMSAPTKRFSTMRGLPIDEAARWLVDAVRTRPIRIEPRIARHLRLIGTVAPGAVDAFIRRAIG